MSRPLLLILLLGFGLGVKAQLETNYWFFGNRAGLDFSCHPPTPIYGMEAHIYEGSASMSDQLGNFLFATDGEKVYDRNFDVMPNGNGLAGGCQNYPMPSGTQPAIIIPDPADEDRYYIFTTDCVEDTLSGGFRFSIVDMNANGGNGDVIFRDSLLYAPTCEKLTATDNGSGGYWVLSHEFGTSNFYAYEITINGISSPVISTTGQVHYYTPISAPPNVFIPEQIARGTLKFTPDGTRLVSLSTPDEALPVDQYVIHPEIFTFDKNSGLVSSEFMLQHPDSVPYYGAAFSPDESKLYLSGGWYHPYVHQFDLSLDSPEEIVGSRTLINITPDGGPYKAGAMQLGNDGRIYLAGYGFWLNSINLPDAAGSACDFEYQSVMLPQCPDESWPYYSLPNFIQSYFVSPLDHDSCLDHITAAFTYSGDCSEEPVQFIDQSSIFPETIQHWSWNFGDPNSGAANFSNLPDPQHLFSSPGSYQVQLIAQTDQSPICKIDSISYTIVIESCIITNVEELDLSQNFHVFPNPSDDEFNVSVSTTGPIRLQLHDTSGKIIWEYAGPNKVINFGQEVAAGLYVLRVDIGHAGSQYLKVVKK